MRFLLRLLPLVCGLAICLLSISTVSAAETGNRLSKAFDDLLKQATAYEAAKEDTADDGLEVATFGSGCFWCTEAVFEELVGVEKVVSGYMGGHVKNPTYEQVCSKRTGHAEVIHLRFDPKVVSYAKLLEAFWRTHDPTKLNQQGHDKGPQYRSAVFYHTDEQKELATKFKQKLNEAHAFGKPIVTEVTKASKFYVAEGYHQNYYKQNGRAGYCQQVISPKMKKFRRVFADELKQNPKNRVKAGAGR